LGRPSITQTTSKQKECKRNLRAKLKFGYLPRLPVMEDKALLRITWADDAFDLHIHTYIYRYILYNITIKKFSK